MFSFFSTEPDCYKLNWGSIQVDGYNDNLKEALSVYNFDISNEEKINSCLVLLTGKTIWISKNLPDIITQKIVFDLRGQPITFITRARKMKSRFLEILFELKFNTSINIEILI